MLEAGVSAMHGARAGVNFLTNSTGLGTWLPNMMAAQGMTITKSLTYTFGMTLASATRNFPTPRTRSRGSTTSPIRQVQVW